MTTQIPRTRPLPQRVCETTESPEIHTVNTVDGRKIRKTASSSIERLDPTFERGQHDISDELTFTNHKGYVFHDSRGLECGGEKELQIVQDFIRDRSERGKLQDRIHVIWHVPFPIPYVSPHSLATEVGEVPVIAVFTKYEVFRLEVRFSVEDKKGLDGDDLLDETGRECEKVFQEKYLNILGEEPKVVRLEGMERDDGRCHGLIGTTVAALNDEVVTLMLLAVQRGKLELSVRYAVER
ncbi:hypothetical protein B0H14DRAFT_3871938 [Mycena olivaceomarginata]|nr:hypothetical protein B0H14DRAFT_3871938 [Mycena olivaceomarginata]